MIKGSDVVFVRGGVREIDPKGGWVEVQFSTPYALTIPTRDATVLTQAEAEIVNEYIRRLVAARK